MFECWINSTWSAFTGSLSLNGKTTCLTRWLSKSAVQPPLKLSSYKPSFAGSVTLSEWWKTTGFRSMSSSANSQQESAWQADHYNGTKTAWRSTLKGVHSTLNSSVWTPRIGLAGGPRAELQSRSLKLLASRHYKTKELAASKLMFTLERGHVQHVLAFVHLASDSAHMKTHPKWSNPSAMTVQSMCVKLLLTSPVCCYRLMERWLHIVRMKKWSDLSKVCSLEISAILHRVTFSCVSEPLWFIFSHLCSSYVMSASVAARFLVGCLMMQQIQALCVVWSVDSFTEWHFVVYVFQTVSVCHAPVKLSTQSSQWIWLELHGE